MINKKKEVGKGLRSLLSNIENNHTPSEKNQLVKELANQIVLLPLELIEANPFQPRTEFDSEELLELAKSIKANGLIQAITVRSLGDGKYQLISGERRLRASKLSGIKEIPAYVRIANDQEMLEMALVENIQRANLNALEIAISYQRLMDECHLTHDELSERVGKDRSTVTNYVRLLKLSPEIQQAVKTNQLSMGHARSLAGVENPATALFYFKKCVEQNLSVRALENLIRENQKESGKQTNTSGMSVKEHPEVTKIRTSLSQKFGSKIEIRRDEKGKGVISLRFSDDKEFNNIINHLL